MKTWMLPWLFPLGLLGAVAFVVEFNGHAALIAVPLGLVLVPLLWPMLFRDDGSDPDTNYWRIPRP